MGQEVDPPVEAAEHQGQGVDQGGQGQQGRQDGRGGGHCQRRPRCDRSLPFPVVHASAALCRPVDFREGSPIGPDFIMWRVGWGPAPPAGLAPYHNRMAMIEAEAISPRPSPKGREERRLLLLENVGGRTILWVTLVN